MKNKKAYFIFAVCLLAFGIILIFLKNNRTIREAASVGEANIIKDARNLKNTTMTSSLDTSITLGMNVIWCGTIRLAWDELCNLAGEKLQYQNKNPYIDLLNNEKFTGKDLDNSKHVSMAGFYDEGIVAKIEKELKAKFHSSDTPYLLDFLKKNIDFNVLAYSYLYVDLPFEHFFMRHESPLNFGGSAVENFGIDDLKSDNEKQMKAARQVFVYYDKNNSDYEQPEEYVVELKTKSTTDRLILAKIKPEKTLLKTIEKTQKFLKDFKRHRYDIIGLSGKIAIPVLNFNIVKDYSELSGILKSKSTKLDGRPLIAYQTIRFKLDEKGAVLKSEAFFTNAKAGLIMIFDKPFLIMIKQKGSDNPYFAAWVDNAEILVPYKVKNN